MKVSFGFSPFLFEFYRYQMFIGWRLSIFFNELDVTYV